MCKNPISSIFHIEFPKQICIFAPNRQTPKLNQMKKFTFITILASLMAMAVSCSSDNSADNFKWQIDSFDDIKVLRYKVHGFEELPLEQKELIYYLNQAALWGRDIMFDRTSNTTLPFVAPSRLSTPPTMATKSAPSGRALRNI